jgi:hypothetical protein
VPEAVVKSKPAPVGPVALVAPVAPGASHGGWLARFIALILFASAPLAILATIINYRDTRNLDSHEEAIGMAGSKTRDTRWT